jgi:hypothetical protein
MNRSVCIAITLFAVFCAATPALANKKRANGSLAAIQTECFKENGAYLDPVTKRYRIRTTQMGMMTMSDALRKCIAEKSGARHVNIRETRRF